VERGGVVERAMGGRGGANIGGEEVLEEEEEEEEEARLAMRCRNDSRRNKWLSTLF
jgi:hypothetical protein